MSVIDDRRKQEIIRILETGCIKDVMKRFNVSRPTVSYSLRKWGLNAIKIRENYREKIIKKNPDSSNKYLSKLLGVSVEWVSVTRSRIGCNAFKHYTPSEEDKSLIIELLKTLPAYEVAVKFDISSPTLTRLLKKMGTSVVKIRRDFRIEHIKKNINDHNVTLAEHLNCSEVLVYKLKRDIRLFDL